MFAELIDECLYVIEKTKYDSVRGNFDKANILHAKRASRKAHRHPDQGSEDAKDLHGKAAELWHKVATTSEYFNQPGIEQRDHHVKLSRGLESESPLRGKGYGLGSHGAKTSI